MPSSEITLTEKTETSVNVEITRTRASAPTMASSPTSAGIEAATRLPKISSARSSTMRHRDRLGAGQVLTGDLVDVVEDRERAGEVGVQPGVGRRLERRGQLVVVGQVVVLAVAGQRDEHLGRVAVGADQPGGLGCGVVGDDGGGGARREPGDHLLDGGPELRVGGGEVVAAVDGDHVDALVAEGVPLGGQLPGRLGARVVEAALREVVEDAEAVGSRGDRHGEPGQQHGQGPAGHECSPALDHGDSCSERRDPYS